MARKRIVSFYLISGVLMLIFSACASIPQDYSLLISGQFAELENYESSQHKDFSSAGTSDLFYWCTAYYELKKYNKLFPCLEQLETNIHNGDKSVRFMGGLTPKSDMSPMLYLLRAEAYIELGNYDKAIEEALKLHNMPGNKKYSFPHRSSYAETKTESLPIFILSYSFKGEKNKAKEYLTMLENIYRPNQPAFVPARGPEVRMNLAQSYMALGEFDKSLPLADSLLNEFEKSGMKFFVWAGSLAYGDSFIKKAVDIAKLPLIFIKTKSLYETGNVKDAKKGYDLLLKIPEIIYKGDIYWVVLFDRGQIAEKERNLTDAIEFYRQAVEVIERQRASINTEAYKIGYVGDKQKVYHRMISALFSSGQYAKAFEYVERSKSRALVDLLASKKEFSVKEGNEQEINATLKDLEAVEIGGTGQESIQAPQQISQGTTRSIQIKDVLRTNAPELASLTIGTPVSVNRIQSLVSGGESLIEYYYYGEDLYAFILTKDTLKAAKLDGRDLAKNIEQFRRALQNPQLRQYFALSQKLFESLIKPVEHMLNTKNLIIVPHGALHYLPFNALYGESDYFIDRYSITYLPSASVMDYLKNKKTPKTTRLLAFGNPDLEDPKYFLKYAQEEVVTIAKGFSQTKVLLQKEATETAFKKTGDQFNYIHIATHGLFHPDSALNSGLFLAKDDANDGFLSVNELYSLRLHANMVTLSACETGLGKISNGDDVVGLTRGFLYAGSNSIVASLWKVDDLATSYLMSQFYSNLKKANKRDALRQAQLAAKKEYGHPFYWAAFQLTGIEQY